MKWWTSTGTYESCPIDDTTPAYITATVSSITGQKALYLNSTNFATDGDVTTMEYNTNTVGLSIGQYNNSPSVHSQFIYGDLAEMLVFSSVDPVQQAAVESYLRQKYFAAVRPAPRLSVQLNAKQLTLSWTGTGFILQQTSDLSKAAGWTDVTGATTSPVTRPVTSATAQFFRLRKQ